MTSLAGGSRATQRGEKLEGQLGGSREKPGLADAGEGPHSWTLELRDIVKPTIAEAPALSHLRSWGCHMPHRRFV